MTIITLFEICALLGITFTVLRGASEVDAFSSFKKASATKPKATQTPTCLNIEKELKPLPSRRHGPFRNIRDSISYIRGPDKFIQTRVKELGPVFQTHVFFRPTVRPYHIDFRFTAPATVLS